MRLHKNDTLKLDDSKFGPIIATVERFDANGGISLVAHIESNADQRYRQMIEARRSAASHSTRSPLLSSTPMVSPGDDVYIRLTAGSLKKNGARRIYIDEIGRIRDAGPHDRR
jgi:CRISPR-associated endonuclease Csn1